MHRRIDNPEPRTFALSAIVLAFALSLSLAVPSWALGGWARVPHDSAVFGSTGHVLMFDVAESPTGFVAVGTDSGTNGAAFWWSTDGDTWTRVPAQQDFNIGLATGVVEGPTEMVAVGYLDTANSQNATVWTGNEMTWTRIPVNAAVLGGPGDGDQRMSDVCVGGPGLVAVGADNASAAVWHSPDGTTWARVPHNAAVFGGLGFVEMFGVTAGGPGLVAVGRDDSGGDSDAAVWTSVDGLTWTRVPHVEAILGGPLNQTMYSVAAGEDGLLVAVGNDDGINDGGGAVWTSTDGTHWTRVPHVEAVFGGPNMQSLDDVAPGGPGYVAVGSEWGGTWRVGAAWTSVDGTVWEREPHDPTIFGRSETEAMRAVAIDGYGRVVAIGQFEIAGHLAAAVWTNDTWSETPGPVVDPAIPVPTDGPTLIDDPSWLADWGRPMIFAIVVSTLILWLLVWGVIRHRRAGR